VFSKIARVAIISLLGSATVFCQDAQDDVPQPSQDSPAQQAAQNPEQRRIRVGEKVAAAQLIRQVSPVYPPLAKTAHISGIVLLHAMIGKDGMVEDLQYVSGPPLLMESAMKAVRQWQYKPTLLMGEPVAVETTISVVYTLRGKDSNATESGAPGSSAEARSSSSQDVPKDASTSQDAATEGDRAGISAPKPGPVSIGDRVAAATLIHQVAPVYPTKAKKQHIAGTVLLHAIITKDGTIRALEYVSGPPELKDSAIDAVKKWRYKPKMVNGEPVELDTKISVVFTLPGH
jgi:TonB family protein